MGSAPATDVGADVPVDRFLKLSEVMAISGLGRTMIYRLIKLDKFPKPYKPGGDASRWDEAEVRAWKARVMAERDAA